MQSLKHSLQKASNAIKLPYKGFNLVLKSIEQAFLRSSTALNIQTKALKQALETPQKF